LAVQRAAHHKPPPDRGNRIAQHAAEARGGCDNDGSVVRQLIVPNGCTLIQLKCAAFAFSAGAVSGTRLMVDAGAARRGALGDGFPPWFRVAVDEYKDQNFCHGVLGLG